MNNMEGHEVERRKTDRRQGERRLIACRRVNSARAHSGDMVFRSGRRHEERRKFDRREDAV